KEYTFGHTGGYKMTQVRASANFNENLMLPRIGALMEKVMGSDFHELTILVQTHPQRSLRQPALVIEHLVGCAAIEYGQPAALVADFQKPLGGRLSVAPPPQPLKTLGHCAVHGLGKGLACDPGEFFRPTVSILALDVHVHDRKPHKV